MSYFLNKTYKTFWCVWRNTNLSNRVTIHRPPAENFSGRENFFEALAHFSMHRARIVSEHGFWLETYKVP